MSQIIIPLTTGPMIKVGGQVSGQVSGQATMSSLDAERLSALLEYCSEPRTRSGMQEFCGIKSRDYFRTKILVPMIQLGKVLLNIPDKPNSPKQRSIIRRNRRGIQRTVIRSDFI